MIAICETHSRRAIRPAGRLAFGGDPSKNARRDVKEQTSTLSIFEMEGPEDVQRIGGRAFGRNNRRGGNMPETENYDILVIGCG